MTMSYIDRLDKDELRYTVEEQERYKKEALQILRGITLGEWDHKACGCSYGCGDPLGDGNIKDCDCQDGDKLEVYYNAIKEAIKCLEC